MADLSAIVDRADTPQGIREGFAQLTEDHKREMLLQACTTYVLDTEWAGTWCVTCSMRRPLRKCTQCGYTAYCSRECQREHWKTHHRIVCRPPGVLRRGDLVHVSKAALAAAGVADGQAGLCALKEQKGADSWLVIVFHPDTPQCDLWRMWQDTSLVADRMNVIPASELALDPAMFRRTHVQWFVGRVAREAEQNVH